MVTGIEHTAIASPDPVRLARWYVDTLGFEINYFSEKSKTSFVRTPNGSMLEIIQANERPRPEAEMRDAGLRHLALTVADFASAYARLRSKGVHFLTGPEIRDGNSVVFFTDPDGNILHLLQRAKAL